MSSRDTPSQLVLQGVRADGLFELVLGLAFVIGPLAGLVLPAPVSTPLTVGFGLLLLVVGVALWLLAGRLGRWHVVGLACINALGAVVFTAWLLLSWTRFSPPGVALIVTTAAGLAILATVELAGELLRR
jgi:hypothetical protein